MPARTPGPKLPKGIYRSGARFRWIIWSPVRDSKSGYATAAEAERDRNIRLGELARGIGTKPSRETVTGWMTLWLEAHARAISPATQGDYADWLRLYIVPHIGDVKLRDLSVTRVQRWHAQLLAGEPRNVTTKRGEPHTLTRAVAPKTVMEAHTLLVSALEAAFNDGLVARNVARLAGGVLVEVAEPVIWTQANLLRFESAASDDRLYALWYLAAWSGLRIGELLALRWQDVNLTTRMVRVWRNRSEDRDRKPIIVSHTKTRRIRDVELPPECVQILTAHKSRQNEHRLAEGRFWTDQGLVFANDRGGMRSYSGARQSLQRLCRRIGVPVVSPHALRHLHGSLLGAAGVGQRDIADRLGHASLQTTARYVHGMAGVQTAALQKVRARLDEAG